MNFSLDNPSHQGKPYILILTLTGTTPGFRIGNLQVPINYDVYTDLALNLTIAGSPAFRGFLGTLDPDGNAQATMTLPPLPGLQGRSIHFSFVQYVTSWTYASPPTKVSITN